MAGNSRTFTIRVRMNSTQFERTANQMSRTLNKLNQTANKAIGQGVTQQLERSATVARGMDVVVGKISKKVQAWANKHKNLNSSLKSSDGLLGSIWQKLRGIAATYLGIMGGRAILNTSDTITKAKNKLNYANAQALGSEGMTSMGTYSSTTLSMTEKTMDKMYTSAQKVSMSYTDMMSNVSKSMTLASDAFGGNIDNAIRFQEIMSESYTLGGASIAEQHSSMYQLIQALGSGTLAGDELRSVREGAPLAYKEIEKFCQSVLKSEESLKDLASEGLVTSDMVVAAIMKAGDAIDVAYKQSSMTFEQFGQKIKNMATKAFEPVADELRDTLNVLVEDGLMTKIESAFVNISKVLQIAFRVLIKGAKWIYKNWDTIKTVLVGALSVVVAYLVAVGVQSVISATAMFVSFLAANPALVIIVAILAAILYGFYLVVSGAKTMSEVLIMIAAVIGIAFLIVGLIIGSIPLLIIGAIILVIAFFDKIVGAIFWCGALILNVVLWVVNVIVGILAMVGSIILNSIIGVINSAIELVYSIINPILSIIEFILNACNGGFKSFEAGCANLIGQIIGWFLQLGKVVTTIIDAIFGTNWTGGLEKLRANVTSWGKTENAITLTGEAPLIKTIDPGNAFKAGYGWQPIEYANLGDAFRMGDDLASSDKLTNWINGGGDKLSNWFGNKTSGLTLDALGEKLGLDLSGLGLPNEQLNPSDLGGLLDDINDTAGNTEDMKNSMALAEEDLKYLRDLAAREWKREYTTATIQVDMSNYNTVNGDGDLDGICTKLADKLYEEMSGLANGVY